MTLPIVAVAVPRNVDQTFDYVVPANLAGQVKVGQRVLVDFGKEKLEGFITALKEKSDYKGSLRPIRSLLDSESILNEHDLELARWIADYYLTPIGMVLRIIAPHRELSIREGRSIQFVHLAQELKPTLELIEKVSKRAPQQAALLKTLLTLESITDKELLERVGCGPRVLQQLVEQKIVTLEQKPVQRNISDFYEAPRTVQLNADQTAAIRAIEQGMGKAAQRFLLHGINGSGKTEVYLHIAQRALEMGKQTIVLVPEISLTPQLLARFRHRFSERIAVYHSGLTESEKSRQWDRIKNTDAQIAIGVRSAIFAPFDKLGLIIVDEEHESTYKQEDPAPRYHLREVALRRAQLENATVVLGSGTPSLETYYYAQTGAYQLLEMKTRVAGAAFPSVQIVELGDEQVWVSPLLREKITDRLRKNEQVILLLNRLGYAFAICKECKQVVRCPTCGIALTLHIRFQHLSCRYCGYDLKLPKCRNCGSANLSFWGAGTERIELELRKMFGTATIRRMDSESVQRGQHGVILEEFRQGKIQILLGTQMIGLGLDFPNVTLVGVISADTILDLPDFRAGERTFQLISQAGGRAGRGEKGGEVIIQTRHPEHYAIQLAAHQDYRKFYEQEIEFRREFNYPPFSQLIELIVQDSKEETAHQHTLTLQEGLSKLGNIELIGAAKALPYRWHGAYRWKFLLKSKDATVKENLRLLIRDLKFADRVTLNVDPQL
ncbi:primosomal protein N' [Candidatus Acetothermia bacterium]|nr:primosomal protein N' [Candidatus Acetothermia bacterium]